MIHTIQSQMRTHHSPLKLRYSYHDGCDCPSTKDNTNQRRKRNEIPRIVDVKTERLLTGTKDQFLNITTNKEALIRLISDKLCQNGCKVVQAEKLI